MPTYEFRCPQGHEFEKFYRTISGAEAQAACPVCGQPAERIMSAAGFAFKGSGFYLTDYGKNAHREKPPAEKSDAKSETSASGSASEGEAKPAAKSDAPATSEPKKTESSKAADTKPAAAPAKKKSAGE
jgi:putative FmdB family regulatory protein